MAPGSSNAIAARSFSKSFDTSEYAEEIVATGMPACIAPSAQDCMLDRVVRQDRHRPLRTHALSDHPARRRADALARFAVADRRPADLSCRSARRETPGRAARPPIARARRRSRGRIGPSGTVDRTIKEPSARRSATTDGVANNSAIASWRIAASGIGRLPDSGRRFCLAALVERQPHLHHSARPDPKQEL